MKSMKAGAAFFIALRYLWGRAREGGRYLRGAAAGIGVSLIPIIVTLIVADGMIRGIVDRYLELGTGHIQVFNFFEPGEFREAGEKLAGLEGLRGIWQERRGMAVIAGRKGRTGAAIRAIDPSFWEDSGGYLVSLEGVSKPETGRDVLLGESLASAVGAETGDTIRILTLGQSASGGGMPRVSAFTVRGIVSSGYHELDALWCVVSPEGGNRILFPEFSSTSLLVKIGDPYRGVEAAAGSFRSVLGHGYSVYTWKDLMRSRYSSYVSTRQLLLFIMALVVTVAAVNVSSATSMLVIERRRDIAILKAQGASASGIRSVFLWGGFLTGLAGTAAGIAVGLFIGNFINQIIYALERILNFFSGFFSAGELKILDPGYYLETIPVVIDWPAVFLVGCFAIVCSVIASWIPAGRAGRLMPLELLRKY